MTATVTKTRRPLTQRAKRTLTFASAILVLDYYAGNAISQRRLVAHFKGTEHKIHQPKLTALINGTGFKDWEKYPEFIEARNKARAKADRANRNGGDRATRANDASKTGVQFDETSPSEVYAAKRVVSDTLPDF